MTTVAPPVRESVRDLGDDELFEIVFNSAVPLTRHLVLMARGWQIGSPWGLLGKALCVAACDASDTSIVSGMGSGTVPLNPLIGFVGASGLGKGQTMQAPLHPQSHQTLIDVPFGGKPAFRGKRIRWAHPASGEQLVSEFFDEESETDDKGKERKVLKQHGDPVWADWAEIDNMAAKMKGVSASTLEGHLRSIFSGESVGDKSISRAKAGVGMVVEKGTYRCVVTVGVQPTRAAPLVRDGGGGTVQRIIFLGIDDEDAPEVRDLLGIRRELCQRLGVPLPTTLKTLPPHIAVHGPASADLHDDVVLDMLETRGKVLRGGGVVDAADTHRDNNRIRLAAIYAAWKRTPGTAVTVMLDDWYWADAVLEHSRRQRLSIIAAADSADTDEARTRGKLTGISQLTAAEERDRVEAARRDADVELVFSKLCARPGLKTRDFHNALSAPQRRGRKAIHMLRDAEDAGRVTENANGWWALDHDGNPITTPPKGNAR